MSGGFCGLVAVGKEFGGAGVAGDGFEAEVFGHSEVFRCRLVFRGQVVTDEDQVGRVETHGLQRSEVDFAAAGDADFDVWIGEAEQAECFSVAAVSGPRIPRQQQMC